MNERAFIARLENANTDELILILSRPSPEEDRVLRVHLGAARYERLRRMALRTASRSLVKKGNVVLLHGIMGGELQRFERNRLHPIWMSFPRLIFGAAEWLAMNKEGDSVYDIRVGGLLKRWYSELQVALAFEWNVYGFAFDWRRDLAESAAELNKRINEWFGPNSPVHLVGHSMGGLVSRTFIQKYPERWARAWDSKKNGLAGGRLVMLGTPNHGSFAIPQICTGVEASVRKLILADLQHSASQLVGIVNTFPGSYQMLPSPAVMPAMEKLYRSETYGAFGVRQALLDNALRSHEALAPIVDLDRMIYVAGYNRRTYDDIKNMAGLQSIDAYSFSMNGDGTVPHRLGFLEKNGRRIPTYFADAGHGALPNHESVIGTLPELLETGQCSLPQKIPAGVRGAEAKEAIEMTERSRLKMEEARLAQIVQNTNAQTRGAESDVDMTPVSREEKEAEAIILRSFLGEAEEARTVLPAPPVTAPPPSRTKSIGAKAPSAAQNQAAATIEIGLVKGGIDSVTAVSTKGQPIDALAVGHYFGVRPQAAERALDDAISAAYFQKADNRGGARGAGVPESELLLTLLTDRGHISGNLGEPFILPDPRQPGRIVVLVGMGVPGHFGVPELTVVAQELCWSLGRLQKSHLATVLIGAGTGNLPVRDAVTGWLRGIRRALVTSTDDVGRRICRVTFVERSPTVLHKLDLALRDAAAKPPTDLVIDYHGPTDRMLADAKKEALSRARKRIVAEFKRDTGADGGDERVPVRITVERDRKGFRFAALTQSAAIPQRDIAIDPRLVDAANDELAGASSEEQMQAGRFLEKLLLPEDIRSEIYTPAPIVLMVDSSTARVHWEMVARTEPWDRIRPGAGGAVDLEKFLGTSYGLTRQLRTTFAPAPEAPPPPKRVIRALIVADPAADAPLEGAQAEGEEVASLLESFQDTAGSQSGFTIEVTRLFGPAAAKRTTVLKKLMLEDFDILHFAGHCIYDKDDPANSGWVFSKEHDERLTANELKRIDRVPKFIFSNACESGITPDRASERSAGLAPSFAEAFFARGVANFVCTAWPVNDTAARNFARLLYTEMFGLAGKPAGFLHEAMREARKGIAGQAEGARTWGAYQHYGNPYFRFLGPPGSSQSKPAGRKAAPRKNSARARKKKSRSAKTAGRRKRKRG
ncbi:MAG TPA: CHAT domain-containing protein [Chthoniobacterales bacterium]|nr:CHAT domain-containing protein [Chthoniobacterales bacterium]